MKYGWFTYLHKPIDFGQRIGKTEVFGPNKNWRGAFFYILGGTLVTYLLHLLQPTQNWIAPVFSNEPLLLGISSCSAYVLGELINSFVKRRLGIAPGSQGKLLQKFVDNSDGALATGVIYLFVYGVSLNLLLAAFVISLLVHASTDVLMRRLRLKSK
jgi:predicted CDP-diglyceride synthetase/phosphatidate cytidylyltransferase